LASPTPTRFRIQEFELDAASGELRKAGTLVKLQPQPFRVLLLLVERAGHLVTREEIQRCLWTDSTFVDFEHGINFSINQIREALKDDAEKPRYVETLPRRGYRFIAPVEPQTAKTHRSKRISRLMVAPALAFLLLALVAGLWKWLPLARGKTSAMTGRRAMAVVEIENLSQDPSLNWMGDGVIDLIITDLAQDQNLDVISSERVRSLSTGEVKPGESLPANHAQQVAKKAGADVFITGGILRMGQGLRLDLRVQDTATGKVLVADKVEGSTPQAIFSMVDRTTARIVSQLTPETPALQPNAAALTSNLDALQAYEEGISDLDRHFTAKASDSFRRATKIDPGFAMAYYYLGILERKYTERHEALARAAELAQRQSLPEQQKLLIRVLQLYVEGRGEEASQTLETLVRLFPKEVEPRIELAGDLQWQRGRLPEAALLLEETAQFDAKRPSIYNSLAYIYAVQRDLPRALAAVDKYAALLPPNDLGPLYARAEVYALCGKFDNAIAEYDKSIKSLPESEPGLEIAIVYLLAGRYREAEEKAKSYRKTTGPNALTENVLGDIAVGRGELDQAVAHFTESARLHGADEPELARRELWKAAEIYFEQGEPQSALAWAKRTRQLGAAEISGVAYLLSKNQSAAESEFATARSAMTPVFGDYVAGKMIARDRMLVDGYSALWHEVIAAWPTLSPNPVISFFPGRAYAEIGMWPQAEQELRAALIWSCCPHFLIESYTDFFRDELTRFYLGKVLENEGKTAEAIEAYSAFLIHFEHSTARLPQIAEARAALHRLR
jgi:DNA-binding winged helix-turn-helix (wHTH) protein/tetratricopeptide (TPR) repeat protein/TolB-like protein